MNFANCEVSAECQLSVKLILVQRHVCVKVVSV